MKKMASLVIFAAGLLYCSAVLAGPMDNAQQFQQKAAKAGVKGTYDKALKPREIMVKPAEGGFVSMPAETRVNTGSTSTQAGSGKAVTK